MYTTPNSYLFKILTLKIYLNMLYNKYLNTLKLITITLKRF